jgi:hypothetical protein
VTWTEIVKRRLARVLGREVETDERVEPPKPEPERPVGWYDDWEDSGYFDGR